MLQIYFVKVIRVLETRLPLKDVKFVTPLLKKGMAGQGTASRYRNSQRMGH
jgi:hypothetical protein